MTPSGVTSTLSALGRRGSPGMVVMSPVMATRKPAPAEMRISLTVILNPRGRFSRAGSSDSER